MHEKFKSLKIRDTLFGKTKATCLKLKVNIQNVIVVQKNLNPMPTITHRNLFFKSHCMRSILPESVLTLLKSFFSFLWSIVYKYFFRIGTIFHPHFFSLLG